MTDRSDPTPAQSQITVLTGEWWLDINDDQPAPGNAPVPNNVVTLTVENARFAGLPSACLTSATDPTGTSVSPISSLASDKHTIICNLGTRVEGAAERLSASMLVDGPAGSFVTTSASYRTHEAPLPLVPIVSPFAMDLKLNQGAPRTYIGTPMTEQWGDFPFSLTHRAGSAAGPTHVSYDLTIQHAGLGTYGPEIVLRDEACTAQRRVQAGYPFSGANGTTEANATTRFPRCTIDKIGTSTFRLTLSDLDYSVGPQFDSNGQPLPAGYDVIAAGEVHVAFRYVPSSTGRLQISAAPAGYTSTMGDTAEDETANNTNQAPYVRGKYTGGWIVQAQRPKLYPGAPWVDSTRAPAGAVVMSVGANALPVPGQRTDNWVCKIMDTKHVTLADVRVAYQGTGADIYYNTVPDAEIWYYTGTVDDPNTFVCGGTETVGHHDSNAPGWVQTPPADLSTVTAVKTRIGAELASTVASPQNMVFLMADVKINPDTPTGTDIWTWTSVLTDGNSDWTQITGGYWERSFDPADVKPFGVLTPNARYPYSGPFRDILRVVGSTPLVQLAVESSQYLPGDTVRYTISSGLETVLASPAPESLVLSQTLPLGLTYTPGSAPTEPAITTDAQGRQVLRWDRSGVVPNSGLSPLSFTATLSYETEPGTSHSSTVSAVSQSVERTDTAEFCVPSSGYVALLKSTDVPIIDLSNGEGRGVWTITMTSHDPHASMTTDLIDILPWAGDSRGSRFSGVLALTEVVAPEGASVYYTTVAPRDLAEDPGDPANGSLGHPSSIWTTTYAPQATAIRVIGGRLLPGASQQTTVTVAVHGASSGNRYHNSAVARASSTQLRMRTSAPIEVTMPAPTSTPTPAPVQTPTPTPIATPTPSPEPPAVTLAATGVKVPSGLEILPVFGASCIITVAIRCRARPR